MAPSSRRAVALHCRPGTLHASLTRPTNLRVHRANRAGNDEEELGELDHAEYHLDDVEDLGEDNMRLGETAGTDGNETRCSSVLEGISPGDIDCNAWNPVLMHAGNRGCLTDAG